METNLVTKVNNVDILVSNDVDKLVPIKPICEALGIDPKVQRNKIQEHPLLASTGVLTTSVAGDGKAREMYCLPFEFVLGWLCTINPMNVAEKAREAVIMYQKECYHALYMYFAAKSQFVEQKQLEIDKQLEILENAKQNFKLAKGTLTEAEAKLKKLRSLTMDDYDTERRQLKFDF